MPMVEGSKLFNYEWFNYELRMGAKLFNYEWFNYELRMGASDAKSLS